MKNNIFQKARIKLTLYYIFMMAVILVFFSSVLVYTIEIKIKEGFRGRVLITEIENDPVKKINKDIEVLIYTVDGALLIIIGFCSYLLAGKTLEPIKEALDAQKKFSADASHDLRTPLAIITTESEVTLQNKNASSFELRNSLESNLEETKKMSKLVQDLLLVSRGEHEDILKNTNEVDLHDFLTKLISKFKKQIEEKNLILELSSYSKILLKIEPNSFNRLISNILQNAINYTKKGSIVISLREDNKNVFLEIKDTGVGISKKDLPFVFDRFYKAEHSRNDESGSGLGLPIAKQIVKQYKGNITINSKVNVGTKVEISIPKIS